MTIKNKILNLKPDLLYLFVLIGISVIIRFLFWHTIPPNISGDEITNLSDVYKILYQPGNHLLSFFGDGSTAGVNFYPVAFLVKTFGIANSIYYFRFFIAFCSILAVISFYLILKSHVNSFIAFCFSLLLSSNYVFINFSRTAWINEITIFTILVLILFLLKFYETKGKKWLILSGIMSGITLYGYHYGRIFVIFLILFMFINAILKKNADLFKKVLLFTLITFSISLPFLYNVILNNGEAVLRRPEATFAFSQSKTLGSQTTVSNIFFQQLDYTLRGFILLDSSTMSRGMENMRYVPLFTSPVNYIIQIYIVLISAFFTEFLTDLPPNFSRGLIYIPLIYFIASLSGNKIFNLIKKYNKKFAIFIFLLVTLILAYYDISRYFTWMEKASLYDARQPAITYQEFPYWQKYQIERVSSGLNPITNYQWYNIRSEYIPNKQ
jgi:4-amino-4-deoxy-L-arabinose transferase-like glycosyltransferase